jgi:hypothetical protein
MKVKKNVLIIALLVVGVLVASGALPLLGILNELPTNGIGYYARGVRGGSIENGGGDLLDSTAYVTSWTGGGNSEKIVIQGHFYASGAFDPEFPRYWYKVTLTVDNSEVKINSVKTTVWTSTSFDTQDFTTGQWYPMEAVPLTLTNPASGSIHVELYGHINYYTPLPKGQDFLFAEDWGNLRSGIGSVKVQNDQVEEGTDASFYVETGFSHSQIPGANPSDAGWFLIIFNPIGTVVKKISVQDEFSGTIKWTVPIGSYSPSSSNVYVVKLRNELINQDDDWFFTIGQGMLPQVPNKPTFKILEGKTPYTVGESITVRISAEKTNNTIMGFWVWVSYETSAGTTTDYIYEKAWFPATPVSGGAYADVTFTWPDTGHARLEASTADSLNLNSGISEMKFTVYGADGGDDNKPPTDYTMLIMGAFIILIAFVLYWKAPIPKPYNLVIALALVALAVYLMYPTLQTVFGG